MYVTTYKSKEAKVRSFQQFKDDWCQEPEILFFILASIFLKVRREGLPNLHSLYAIICVLTINNDIHEHCVHNEFAQRGKLITQVEKS